MGEKFLFPLDQPQSYEGRTPEPGEIDLDSATVFSMIPARAATHPQRIIMPRTAQSITKSDTLLGSPRAHFRLLMTLQVLGLIGGFVLGSVVPFADTTLQSLVFGAIFYLAPRLVFGGVPVNCSSCRKRVHMVGGWLLFASYPCRHCGHTRNFRLGD